MKGKLLQRIGILYNTLINNACDVSAIEILYRENNVQLKKRQIYRDVILLEKFTESKGDKLKTIAINNKKKKWVIIPRERKEKGIQINSDFLYTHFLKKNHCAPLLNKEQNLKYNNFIDSLIKKLQNPEFQIFSQSFIESDTKIFDTAFFIKKSNIELDQRLRHLYWCISNHVKLKIIRTKLDSTCNHSTSTPLFFNPLKIIIHRGSYYIAGTSNNKKIIIFELSEIVEYQVLNSKYKNCSDLTNYLAKELNKRFGISENINNKTYTIILEFTEVTGEFVSSFHFHKTQKFYRYKETIRMEMHCGINRELIGWIMMWMTNVRIVSPLKLSELYNFTLKRIQERMSSESTFYYENLFMER